MPSPPDIEVTEPPRTFPPTGVDDAHPSHHLNSTVLRIQNMFRVTTGANQARYAVCTWCKRGSFWSLLLVSGEGGDTV